jgi:hypothetical protein
MTTLNTLKLTAAQLAPMLRAKAEGDYADEAATELLIAHGTWLGRGDFRAKLVDAVDDGWSRHGQVPMAFIDWSGVPDFLHETPASSCEAGILRIAASIAGTDTGPLSALTYSLDPTNTELVLQALAHAAGWHERHRHAFITGDVAGDLTTVEHGKNTHPAATHNAHAGTHANALPAALRSSVVAVATSRRAR